MDVRLWFSIAAVVASVGCINGDVDVTNNGPGVGGTGAGGATDGSPSDPSTDSGSMEVEAIDAGPTGFDAATPEAGASEAHGDLGDAGPVGPDAALGDGGRATLDDGGTGGLDGAMKEAGASDAGPDAGPGGGDTTDGGSVADEGGTTDGGTVGCTPLYRDCYDKYPGVDAATLCGEIDDGCGHIIACDPEGDNCTGFDNACNDPSKPNQCGCQPRTCADLVPGGAECGTDVDDGCGGSIASCGTGDCTSESGPNWLCGSSSRKCECTPLSAFEACGARECGTVGDGCGTTYDCGLLSGGCAEGRTCDVAGVCACLDISYAPTACGSQACGRVQIGGCAFTCGAACGGPCGPGDDCSVDCSCTGADLCKDNGQCCTPQTPTSLCANEACGSVVTDPCSGTQYTCGCAAGLGCVDKSYIEGASANACLDASVASLLGGYVVRTHAFTDGTISGFAKSEFVSLVKVWKKLDGNLEVIDTGCVATESNASTANAGTRSVTPSHFLVPAAVRQVTQPTSTTWLRQFATSSRGLGFSYGLPSFCDGASTTPSGGADFDTIDNDLATAPTPWSGSQKPWLGTPTGTCTCPTAAKSCATPPADKTCFPAANGGAPSAATDCRLNDIDGDGRPGLTSIFSNGAIISAIAAANVSWEGPLNSTGHHTGYQSDLSPPLRQVVSCTGNALCSYTTGISSSSCGPTYNRVQFRKLIPTDFASMSCSAFYNRSLESVASSTGWTGSNPAQGAVKQSAIDGYFQGMQACGEQGTCPDGMKCNGDNLCWPVTSPGACSGPSDPSCGDGWACGYGNGTAYACWPQLASGTLCND